MRPKSIKIGKYRCFDQVEGFEDIRSINVVVGRNNSGKSSLLEAVSATVNLSIPRPPLDKVNPVVQVEQPIPLDAIEREFRAERSGGTIGQNHWQYGKQFIGRHVTWTLEPAKPSRTSRELKAVEGETNLHTEWHNVVRNSSKPFGNAAYIRLSPDRDIVPEADLDESMADVQIVSPQGARATSLINEFIQDARFPRSLVEATMLRDLNSIFAGDGQFKEIQIQRNPDKNWEVFLIETEKGRVSLSDSGSGLKTVVLVLVLLRLVPEWMKYQRKADRFVFAFEELENNLHPSLVRRLLDYIATCSEENEEFTFFLTTHSSTAIDLLSQRADVSITHVYNSDQGARAQHASDYLRHIDILNDLGVRASDILQANAIVWVEGESDRVYINKWLALATSGRLREGVHYQCLEYGGKNLAHFTVGGVASHEIEDQALNALCDMLHVNRNAIIVMDSDVSAEGQEIRETKQRLRDELRKYGGIDWVTDGREIENYLPDEVITSAFQSNIEVVGKLSIGRFEQFSKFLERLRDAGVKAPGSKVAFARRAAEHFSAAHVQEGTELGSRVRTLAARLCDWSELDKRSVLAPK